MASVPFLREGSTDKDLTYELPDGWSKRIIQRQTGVSIGTWDAYLFPPPSYRHKKLRSVVELINFVLKFKDCKIDARYVNLESRPEIISGGVEKLGSATHKLIEFLVKVNSGQDVKIEDYMGKAQTIKNANRKAALEESLADGTAIIDKHGKVRLKRKKNVKSQAENLFPKFNLSQSLKLEKLFHAAASVPTPEQVRKVFDKKISYIYYFFHFHRQYYQVDKSLMTSCEVDPSVKQNGHFTRTINPADIQILTCLTPCTPFE